MIVDHRLHAVRIHDGVRCLFRAEDDDVDLAESDYVVDAGEDGPLAEDDDLREEDLPALDADSDGDFEETEERRVLDLEWLSLEVPPLTPQPRGTERRSGHAALSWTHDGALTLSQPDEPPKARGLDLGDFFAEWAVDPSLANPGGLSGDPLAPRPAPREITILQRRPSRPGATLGVSTGWILRSSLQTKYCG